MAGNYIPAANALFNTWYTNFAGSAVLTTPLTGLTAPQIAAIIADYGDWNNAYVIATTVSTRTSPNVAAMQAARATSNALIQSMVALIQAFPAVTPATLTDLGLTVRTTTRTPVPTPTDVPLVSVNRLLPLQIELRVKTDGLDTNRFPPGVVGANVWCKIGTVAPISIAECTFVGRATKRFFSQFFDLADAGKNCYYILQFVTRTDLVGPQSTMISSTIPG